MVNTYDLGKCSGPYKCLWDAKYPAAFLRISKDGVFFLKSTCHSVAAWDLYLLMYLFIYLYLHICAYIYIPVIIPVRRWSQWGGLGWGGVGLMTFLAREHIFDATENWGGVGWG